MASIGLADYLLDLYGGASAAYSLRKLNGLYNGPVVRVRRESDNAERDFTAQDINTSVVENWINQQIIPPLDLRELTPTGRDGPLIAAAAAYSLRNLSDSYTGSVVEVRRSSDDQVRSFTAVEVSNGTLLAWVNADVVTYTSDFSAGVDGWFINSGSRSSVDDPVDTGKVLVFTVDTTLDQHFTNGGVMSVGNTYSVSAQVYVPSSNAVLDGIAILDSSGGMNVSYDNIATDQWVNIPTSGTTTSQYISIRGKSGTDFTFQGNGTDVFYVRNVVATQTTADGHVSTWYDQSGNANHATQGTPASQPKIVDAGALNSDGIYFDGTDDELNSPSIAFGDNPNTIFTLVKSNNLASDSWFLSLGSLKNLVWHSNQGIRRIFAGVNLSGDIFGLSPNQELWSAFFDNPNDTGTLHVNGTQDASGSIGTNVVGTGTIRIGANAGSNPHDGWFKEIIIYNSDQSDNRTAFEANIGEVYGIAGIPAYDNTVNGFVETWYDQSGNGNNASQLTASQQPKIVDTGVLVVDRDGKVALNGKGAKLDLPNDVPMLSADGTYSVFAVVDFDDQRNGNDQYNTIIRFDSKTTGGASSLRKPLIFLNQGNGTLSSTGPSYTSGSVDYTVAETLSVQLLTNIGNPALLTGNHTLYADGVLVSSSDLATSVNTETLLQIDSQIFDNQETTVTNFLSEVIYYPSDESANRAAIENNIDNYYGITPAGSYVNAAGDSYINAAGDTYLQP